MNKKTVLNAIELALEERFEVAKGAAKQAHQAATNEESIAENKYDTFGLEASYLAHGQSQRVIECERDWLAFSKVVEALLKNDMVSSEIELYSLIRLKEQSEGVIKWFFISPFAGGLHINVDNNTVYLITPSSPVGKKLLGKELDDEVLLTQHSKKVIYDIMGIL